MAKQIKKQRPIVPPAPRNRNKEKPTDKSLIPNLVRQIKNQLKARSLSHLYTGIQEYELIKKVELIFILLLLKLQVEKELKDQIYDRIYVCLDKSIQRQEKMQNQQSIKILRDAKEVMDTINGQFLISKQSIEGLIRSLIKVDESITNYGQIVIQKNKINAALNFILPQISQLVPGLQVASSQMDMPTQQVASSQMDMPTQQVASSQMNIADMNEETITQEIDGYFAF